MASEMEYMSLAPDVGIIPKKFRNQGYTKLPHGPGEGGLGDSTPLAASHAPDMAQFLTGVAAGADPKALAQQMLASNSTGRARRTQKGVVA